MTQIAYNKCAVTLPLARAILERLLFFYMNVRSFSRKTLITIAVLILVAVAIRMTLPYFVLRYVNRVLNQLPEYAGHVADVDLALIRGAYVIKDFKLEKKNGNLRQPYISIPVSDLSIEWRAIFKGAIVGEIEIENAKLNLVNASDKKKAQTGTEGDWQKMVRDLLPVDINRFAVINSQVAYTHGEAKSTPDVRLEKINGQIENLSNRLAKGKVLPSPVEVKGLIQGYSAVELDGRIDPLASSPTFDIKLRSASLPLEKLNKFIIETVGVDVEGGTIELFSEVKSQKGNFKGYLKPILKNVKIFSLSKDISNPLTALWDGLVAIVAEVFTNQRHDQLATKIPFEGSIDNPELGTFSALGVVVRNAYVKALASKFDSSDSEKE